MINRRTCIKLGIGSISVALASPSIARQLTGYGQLHTIAVFNEDSAVGRALADEIVQRGGEAFPIAAVVDPMRKTALFRQLQKQPSLVIGLTDEVSAFELQMAASDAFHFKLPDEQFSIDGHSEGDRVAWAVAPVAELNPVAESNKAEA